MTVSQNVAVLIDSFSDDPNARRIQKLLFCCCYDSWPTNVEELEERSWSDLLERLLDRATDLDRLQHLLIGVVSHLNKKNAYFILARSVFNRLKVLYPDYRGDITSMGNRFAQVCQLLNDSQDLFSLRLRVSHHSSLSQAKSIVFSAISCRFDYTTQDVNYLNHQEFDDLVRELLYACNSIEDLRFRVFGAASCLDDRVNNLKVATLLCGTIASFYPTLHQNSSDFLSGNASLDDFDRMTAGDTELLDFDAYLGFNLDDTDIVCSGIGHPLSSPPTTGVPKVVTQWPVSPNGANPDSQRSVRDIKDYADRQLQATVTHLEQNLQAVSDYIDYHLDPNLPSNLASHLASQLPGGRTGLYKYRILRELVQGLQQSCATQLDRLNQLEAVEVQTTADR